MVSLLWRGNIMSKHVGWAELARPNEIARYCGVHRDRWASCVGPTCALYQVYIPALLKPPATGKKLPVVNML